MTSAQHLKQFRLFLGLTQGQMAHGVITESFYSKVETGKSKIKAKDLIEILNLNNIALEDFFARKKDY